MHYLEERNLIQKSKLNWLRLGDENTSFFYRFLAAKKTKLFTEILSLDEVPITSFRAIEGEILHYFEPLYKKAHRP